MVYEEYVLKQKLITIKDNNAVVQEDESYFKLAIAMLHGIGSIDKVLRDELIYELLATWIYEERFTKNELEQLLYISIDRNQLFYRLDTEDGEEDDVFKRSFSALIAATILNHNNEKNFLSKTILTEVKDRMIQYMLNEKDKRGYVDEKGWAHSVAHTADALDALSECLQFEEEDLEEILQVIKIKVCTGDYVYIDEENERMVTVIQTILTRNILSEEVIMAWIKSFKIEKPSVWSIESFHMKVNVKGFLRSLYFRLLEAENTQDILKVIKNTLSKL